MATINNLSVETAVSSRPPSTERERALAKRKTEVNNIPSEWFARRLKLLIPMNGMPNKTTEVIFTLLIYAPNFY